MDALMRLADYELRDPDWEFEELRVPLRLEIMEIVHQSRKIGYSESEIYVDAVLEQEILAELDQGASDDGEE
jgi:hypothetical protein